MMMSRYIDQRAPALKNNELDDNELNSVTGGLVVNAIIAVLIRNIMLPFQPTTSGQSGKGGQSGP
jgi:lactobin A/cerein 7B family class IIb bacteriocin